MPDKKYAVILRKAAIAIPLIAGVWLFLRFLLEPVMPFLLGLGLARLMEKPVRLLSARLRLPRAVCAGALTLTAVGVLAALGAALISALWGELNRLVAALPGLMASLPDIAGSWRGRVDIWIEAAPLAMQDILRAALERFLAGGSAIPGEIYARAGALITALAAGLPKTVLFLFTAVLSTFLISCEYPKLTARLMRPFSERARERVLKIKNHLTLTAGKWLKAQVILIFFTFLLLFTGLLAIRAEYALLIAGVTALLDALPVIGIGLVLLPWAVYSFLSGQAVRGAALLTLYAVVSLVRGLTEPKLVGRQIGLPPLLTLMSMYAGFRLWGVPGMILTPFGAMLVKQMAEWGWFSR
ncbi:MAG: sporulation integral membrane protein YtvI [Oscillospiraceae bacterium]|nr:sporulation integral membrane protein YtvI [Oscillospiraceae bacterium]